MDSFLPGDARDTAVDAPTSEVRDELLAILGDIKGCDARHELAGSTDLAALHLDSLDLVDLAVRLERRYGIELGAEEHDLEAVARLEVLADLVARRRRR